MLHINRRALEWLGRDRAEVEGTRLDILGGGTISEEQFRAMLDSSLAGGWRGEVTCVRKDGSSFPAYLETSVLRDPTGESPLVMAVARDITEQRSLQARLIAEEKAGTLGLIARNIAHRVRNHLASINMSLYFLEEEVPPTGEGPTQIETIRQEMHRMRLFLDSLAAYARPPPPEFEEVSLAEVVNQGLDEARPVLRLKSVAVMRQFPADSPTLRLDRIQFARAIAHVVQNLRSRWSIPVSCTSSSSASRWLTEVRWLVEIRDDGRGIAPSLKDRVFEPFFTTTESQLGLGLTMVRRVMNLHGGDVRIESVPGRGSVVTLDLPDRRRRRRERPPSGSSSSTTRSHSPACSRSSSAPAASRPTPPSMREGIERYREARPAFVICDVHLPDGTGLDLLTQIRDLDPDAYVVMITAYDDMDTTVAAIKRGAFDYIHKPFEPRELEIVVDKARENQRLTLAISRLQAERSVPIRANVLVGKSKPMLEVYKTIGVVSACNTTVLITGESGTGKELIARAVHNNATPQEPFVSVNCSAIVETLRESELFGHEKGAFTGATYRKRGKFELAGHGTIFLDEIGDMSANLQTKLLRVLQEREFTRVGGHDVLRTEARVIAATNRNLEGMVAQGEFPGGSVLPAQGHHRPGAAAARAQGRHPASCRALPPKDQRGGPSRGLQGA